MIPSSPLEAQYARGRRLGAVGLRARGAAVLRGAPRIVRDRAQAWWHANDGVVASSK